MSEFDFQEALVRFLTDEKMRASIYEGNLQTQSELGVSPELARRLSQIDRERLEFFSGVIFHNRIHDFIKVLPITAKLLGPQMTQIAHEYQRSVSPIYTDRYDHSLAFAAYLKEQFSFQPLSPEFAEDVLDYEVNTLKLVIKHERSGEEEDNLNSVALSSQLLEDAALSKIIPYRSANHRILRLNYNVPALLQQMSESPDLPRAEKQRTYLLLRINPSGSIEQDKINLPTLNFLNACDGETTLAEIIKGFVPADQQHKPVPSTLKRGCQELCKSLVERRVLYLKSRREATDEPAL